MSNVLQFPQREPVVEDNDFEFIIQIDRLRIMEELRISDSVIIHALLEAAEKIGGEYAKAEMQEYLGEFE